MRTKGAAMCLLTFVLGSAPFGMSGSSRAQDSYVYDSKDKRDPFVPLVGYEKMAIFSLEDVVSVDELRLEGIAVGPKGAKIVIFNSVMMKEGQRIGNLKVVEIGEDAVKITIRDLPYFVNIKEEEEERK